MRFSTVLNSMILSVAVLVAAYAGLTYVKVPVGTLGDWVVGLVALLWLLAIVTVPWNIYFKAKAVLDDAGPTRDRGLAVDPQQVAYVSRLKKAALYAAIALHVASAVTLFVLAVTGVWRVGYAASVLALLLTGLRPAASAYAYLSERLRSIGHIWKYPAEDVVELRSRVTSVESELATVKADLDPARPESVAARLAALTDSTRQAIADAAADLASLRAANDNEHERLSRETRTAISQLTADGQFLEHVREILRFFKSA